MKTKNILFVTYGGGHVNMIMPLYNFLCKSTSYDIEIIGLTTAGFVLKNNSIVYSSFKDYLQLFSEEKVVYYGHMLSNNSLNSDLVPYEETVSYLGINYLELVENFGEKEAARLYQLKGRHAFYPVQSMKKILESINPDIVVATNSPRSERAAIDAAGILGIPSVCIVDLFAFQSKSWIGKSGYATKVCVLSDFVKQQLISEGRDENDIVVTGNPVFDSLKTYRNKSNHSKLSKNSKVILWASQVEPLKHPFNESISGDPNLPRRIEAHLFDIISKHRDWKLILRPHPSDNVTYQDCPTSVVISDKSENLHELISLVDVVITMTSTVAIEAAIIGKHVITVDLSMFTKDSPYSEMGLSRGVSSLDELESVIVNTAESAPEIERIEKIVGNPGHALENISKVISELLKK